MKNDPDFSLNSIIDHDHPLADLPQIFKEQYAEKPNPSYRLRKGLPLN